MKKRLIGLWLLVAMLASMLPGNALASGSAWDGTSASEPEVADGVYQIGTAAELA